MPKAAVRLGSQEAEGFAVTDVEGAFLLLSLVPPEGACLAVPVRLLLVFPDAAAAATAESSLGTATSLDDANAAIATALVGVRESGIGNSPKRLVRGDADALPGSLRYLLSMTADPRLYGPVVPTRLRGTAAIWASGSPTGRGTSSKAFLVRYGDANVAIAECDKPMRWADALAVLFEASGVPADRARALAEEARCCDEDYWWAPCATPYVGPTLKVTRPPGYAWPGKATRPLVGAPRASAFPPGANRVAGSRFGLVPHSATYFDCASPVLAPDEPWDA